MKRSFTLLFAVGVLVGVMRSNAQEAAPPPRISAPPAAVIDEAPALVVPLRAPPGMPERANEIYPSIDVEEAELPSAIRTLARLAGVNIQFDPKVDPGVMGPDGRMPVQPVVSFRWEKISAYQALNALLENHDLKLIYDPSIGIARVTRQDPAALEPLVTRVLAFQHSTPTTNLVFSLQQTLSARSRLFLDPVSNQVLALATEKEIIHLEDMVGRFDLPVRQVLIEADIMETTRNPSTIKGIDWSGTLQAQNFTFGNGLANTDPSQSFNVLRIPGDSTTTETPGGRPITTTSSHSENSQLTTRLGQGGLSFNTLSGFSPPVGFLNADGVRGVLSFLNTDADTESIASPRAVTLDGRETTLSVVRNIPVFEEEQGAAVSGSVAPTSVKPNYNLLRGDTILNEVGIKLNVTPRVIGSNSVFLRLRPEISNVEAVPERKILGDRVNEAPIFARREISTEAMVPSGNTLVLGGLTSDNTTKTFTKVPILGDTPVLGLLFRRDAKQRQKQHLLIFITPTIVQDYDFQPADTRFLETPIPAPPEWRESAWDAGRPIDWTQPKMTAERVETPRSQ